MDMVTVRLRFNLPPGDDLWAGRHLETADCARAAALVEAAASHCALVSVVGPRGAGKTRALRSALRSSGARVVEPKRLDRECVHIGDVVTAIVNDLSDERPYHSGERRTVQARRLLGSAAGPVVLFLDDAHELHGATVRALKRLRELAWRGRSPLLGIVLAGQRDRTGAIPEVGLRTAVSSFGGLTAAEASRAVLDACSGVVPVEAVGRLVASPRARNWLDLTRLVDDALLAAAVRGEGRVTADIAAAVVDPGARRREAPSNADAGAPAAAADAALDAALGTGAAARSA